MSRCRRLPLVAAGALVAVACRGPSEPAEPAGSLEVIVAPSGLLTGTESHTITVTLADPAQLLIRTVPYRGGTVLLDDLSAGLHWVRLESPAETCLITSGNPATITVTAGATSRVTLHASCFGPPAAVFSRTAPPPYGDAERLVLEAEGRFRLQLLTSPWGLSELLGSYWSDADGTRLQLRFDANQGQWQATATPSGPCLGVAFNEAMQSNDFVDGDYCGDAGVPPLQKHWAALAPMPEGRWQPGAAELDGLVYVVGGAGAAVGVGWVARPEIFAYDPALDRWRTAGRLQVAVRAPGVVALGGLLYVLGEGLVQIFDPATGTVQVGPSMPTPRSSVAVAVLDGRIHVLGGFLVGGGVFDDPTADHEVFDPGSGTWSSRAPMPLGRAGHAVAIGGRLYLVAGWSRQVDVYEPGNDAWTGLGWTDLREDPAVVALGGKLYVLGGNAVEPICCSITAAVDRFDPIPAVWTRMEPMITARTGAAAAVVGRTIYVVGGSPTSSVGFSRVNERFVVE